MGLGYIALITAAILSLSLTGCGVSASIYRVDDSHLEQHQNNVPLKCLFVDCNTGSKGS